MHGTPTRRFVFIQLLIYLIAIISIGHTTPVLTTGEKPITSEDQSTIGVSNNDGISDGEPVVTQKNLETIESDIVNSDLISDSEQYLADKSVPNKNDDAMTMTDTGSVTESPATEMTTETDDDEDDSSKDASEFKSQTLIEENIINESDKENADDEDDDAEDDDEDNDVENGTPQTPENMSGDDARKQNLTGIKIGDKQVSTESSQNTTGTEQTPSIVATAEQTIFSTPSTMDVVLKGATENPSSNFQGTDSNEPSAEDISVKDVDQNSYPDNQENVDKIDEVNVADAGRSNNDENVVDSPLEADNADLMQENETDKEETGNLEEHLMPEVNIFEEKINDTGDMKSESHIERFNTGNVENSDLLTHAKTPESGIGNLQQNNGTADLSKSDSHTTYAQSETSNNFVEHKEALEETPSTTEGLTLNKNPKMEATTSPAETLNNWDNDVSQNSYEILDSNDKVEGDIVTSKNANNAEPNGTMELSDGFSTEGSYFRNEPIQSQEGNQHQKIISAPEVSEEQSQPESTLHLGTPSPEQLAQGVVEVEDPSVLKSDNELEEDPKGVRGDNPESAETAKSTADNLMIHRLILSDTTTESTQPVEQTGQAVSSTLQQDGLHIEGENQPYAVTDAIAAVSPGNAQLVQNTQTPNINQKSNSSGKASYKIGLSLLTIIFVILQPVRW